jgi:hypothetical protein
VTDWEWRTLQMASLTLAFGTLFTMAMALVLDLVAPDGHAAPGPGGRAHPGQQPGPRAAPQGAAVAALPPGRLAGPQERRGRAGVSAESLPGWRATDAGGGRRHLRQARSGRLDAQRRPAARVVRRAVASLRSSAEPAPEGEMRPHVAAELGRDPARSFARSTGPRSPAPRSRRSTAPHSATARP